MPAKDHAGRIVGWVRWDGDEYHDFIYQTEDPLPSTVGSRMANGYLPLYVGNQVLLTDDELQAMDISAELANLVGRIVGDGRTRQADLREAVHHIHALQHSIMAQAAARAYPKKFRLLGETL
jgi:hypothetical protein